MFWAVRLFWAHLFYFYYRQKNGKTKSRGSKNGTATSDTPQVQEDPTTAAHSMASTDADTMKQPPRKRGWTVTVVICVVVR